MDINTRIIALNETRLRAWEEGKALLDEVGTREMTAEERQKWDRINEHINELDTEVRDLAAVEQREREAAQLREGMLSVFGQPTVDRVQAAQAHNLRSWIAAGAQGDFEVDLMAAARERELLRSGATPEELRVLQWDATSGSLTVPTTLARNLYEYLEASIAAFRIGATRLNTSTGENLNLPTLTTHAVGTLVATQNTTIAGSDPVFGQVAVNAYRYGQLVDVAADLVRDAAFDLEAWLGRDIGRALGRVIDVDLVVGSGSSRATGMMTYAGAGTNAPIKTGGSLITPTIEKWIDLVYSVNDAARALPSAAFLVLDSTAGTMRKLRDGAGGTVGALLWAPSLTQGVQGGQPDRFLGYPVYTDPNVAAQGSNATMAGFGDWSEYVVRTVGNPLIESSTDFRFDKDQVSYRGKWSAGGNHTQKSHINVMIQNV